MLAGGQCRSSLRGEGATTVIDPVQDGHRGHCGVVAKGSSRRDRGLGVGEEQGSPFAACQREKRDLGMRAGGLWNAYHRPPSNATRRNQPHRPRLRLNTRLLSDKAWRGVAGPY